MEQKLVGTLGHWVTGTPSASAKWSAEQKLVSGTKNSGTKIDGQNKKKVSRTKIGEQNKKKVSRTKIGEQNKKKVSRTKIGERNKNDGTKIGGWNKKKVSRTKIGEWNKNSGTKMAEQKLFIIPSHPNKNWWGQCKCKKVNGTKIGGHCQPLGDRNPKCKCK